MFLPRKSTVSSAAKAELVYWLGFFYAVIAGDCQTGTGYDLKIVSHPVGNLHQRDFPLVGVVTGFIGGVTIPGRAADHGNDLDGDDALGPVGPVC